MGITIKPCHYLMMALKFTHLQHVLSRDALLLIGIQSFSPLQCCVSCAFRILSAFGNIFVIASSIHHEIDFVFSAFAFCLRRESLFLWFFFPVSFKNLRGPYNLLGHLKLKGKICSRKVCELSINLGRT
jgi:hypothetical protein